MPISLILVLGQGCPSVPSGELDSIELTMEAEERVQTQDEGAIIYQVGGVNGPAFSDDVNRTETYGFLAVDPDFAHTVWEVTYDVERDIWTTDVQEGPLIGVNYEDMSRVQMSEAEARNLLAAAGHDDNFINWTLNQPLHPDYPHPLYTFLYNNKKVTVDANTHAVVMTPVNEELPLVGDQPDDDSISRQYIADADARIKSEQPEAVIIWAGGRDSTGNELNEPYDTDRWDFFAIVPEAGPGLAAWTMTYDGQWTVEDFNGVPWGTEIYDLTAIAMDVTEAWQLAEDAGYEPPFEDWTLQKPLNPNVENPNFIFTTSSGFVIVDAVTGDVSVEYTMLNDDEPCNCIGN